MERIELKSKITKAAVFSSAMGVRVAEPSPVTRSVSLSSSVLQRVALKSIIAAGEPS